MFVTLEGHGVVLFDKATCKLCFGIVMEIQDEWIHVGCITDMNNIRLPEKVYKQGRDDQLVWNDMDFVKSKKNCIKEIMEYMKSTVEIDADNIVSQLKEFGPTRM